MLITRPYSPRLSWLSPSRISRPMLRLALDIFHFLSDLPKHVRRNVLRDILQVHRQHPNDPMRSSHVIDDAIAAAFTATRRRPPQFPNATGARYYWARFRVAHEHFLQSGVVVIATPCAPRAHTVPQRPRRHYHASRPPPTIVRSHPHRSPLCACGTAA